MVEQVIRSNTIPKHWLTILLAILMAIFCELALQIRSHFRYGTSIFNAISGETTYVIDENTGLKLLRKNAIIAGSQAKIETNSLGLRSPEIAREKPEGVVRLAVVGASSVMGTYTSDNNHVFAYRLQDKLSAHYGQGLIEVVNAGIAGYSLKDEKQLIEQLLPPLGIDALIIYPGFNDLSAYCSNESGEKPKDQKLYDIPAPDWLLSVELITKNTVWLRNIRAGSQRITDPATLDPEQYLNDLNKLFSAVEEANLPALVLTNPRAYSRDMPEYEQQSLSETARYYSPCFDTNGLHDLYDRHNDLIESAAHQHGFSVFRLDKQMPAGKKYFVDATHFSVFGTEYAAGLVLTDVISMVDQKLLDKHQSSKLVQ